MKVTFLYSFLLYGSLCVNAQDLLTPEQAVEIALKNNYSILISKSQSDIAANNYSLGNAGFLPSLNLNAAGSTSDNSFKQTLSSGVVTERNSVNSNSLTASALFSWTIFDGFRMFATYDRLQALNDMGEIALKIQVENTVSSVLVSYYDVVRQKQEWKANENSLKLYQDRARIAENKYKLGLTPKVDYLQAKVDLNALQSATIRQTATIANSKAALNVLLGRATDAPFEVIDTIVIDPTVSLDELKASAEKGNNVMKFNQRNQFAVERSVSELNGSYYPRVTLNAGYNYSRNASEAGLLALNRSTGPTVGFTATWNLFNGRILASQIRNAHVEMSIADAQYEQSKLELQSSIFQAWNNAKLAFEILKLEEDNILLAKENVTIAMERYKVGNGIAVELQEAQRSLDAAQIRLVAARYEAIQAEIELKRLKGEYVK